MLTIEVNGQSLVLNPEFSLTLRWSNPVCYFDQIPGPYGIGIEIPGNAHNRSILGNPERFTRYRPDAATRRFSGTTVRFSGVLLMEGSLVITHATSLQYSAWLQSELGVMGEEQRERFITDLDWPREVPFTGGKYLDFDDDTHIYGLRPVINRIFWDGKGKEAPVEIRYLDEDGEIQKRMEEETVMTTQFRNNFMYMVNAVDNDLVVRTQGAGCVVSPYLYLRYALKEALRLNRFFIRRNDMIPKGGLILLEPMKNLMIYNNFNIMKQELHTREQIVWVYSYELSMYLEFGVEEVIDIVWEINTFDVRHLLPRITMSQFLLDIQNFLNFAFHFLDDNTVEIIDREGVILSDPVDLDPWQVDQWNTGEQVDVTLKFVCEYDREDSMYTDEFHDLSHRREDYGPMVENMEELKALPNPRIGELRLVRMENRVYEYKWQVISTEDLLRYEHQIDALGWEFVSHGPQPFFYGQGDEVEEIRTGLSTPSRRFEQYGFAWMHMVMQKGNVELSKTAWNDFSFRLMTDMDVFKSQNLNWEGPVGLFRHRWKHFAHFWKTRLPVSGEFQFPVHVLSYVKNNITAKFITSEGAFLIRDMEVEISLYHIGVTRIEGFKL